MIDEQQEDSKEHYHSGSLDMDIFYTFVFHSQPSPSREGRAGTARSYWGE